MTGVNRKLLFYKFVKVGGRLEVVDRNNFPVHLETGYRTRDFVSDEDLVRLKEYYKKWGMKISE